MKKNFKLMLVALLTMVSSTVFAAHDLTTGSEQTIDGISYKVLTVYNTTTSTKVNTVSAEKNNFTGTSIVIPDEVQIAVEGTDEDEVAINKVATFKVVQVKDFSGLSNVTSISVGDNVTTIDEGAFIGTKIAMLDLSETKVTNVARWFTKNEDGKKTNAYLAAVSFPETVTTIAANAFDGCSALSTVEFADLDAEAANVTTINAEAFKGTALVELDLKNTKITTLPLLFGEAGTAYATLTTVKLPKTLVTIPADAFNNCKNLSTVEFAALENTAANVTSIGARAFKKTAITELNLKNTKITELEQLFEAVNSKVTKVVLPKTLETIKTQAFQGLGALTEIDFSACTTALTIKANAFQTTVNLKELTLPACLVALENDALAGSYIETLTITSNTTAGKPTIGNTGATRLTDLTFTGAFKGVIGDGTNAAFTSVETLTFDGTVAANAIAAASFATDDALTTVNFNGNLEAGAVAAGAFAKTGTQEIEVTYAPSGDAAIAITNSFAQNAFAAADAAVWVTFNTTTAYGEKLTDELVADANGNVLYGVNLVFTATPTTADGTIDVAKKDGVGSYYYGTITTIGAIKIAKKQGDANVMVYGAYVDNADATAILMDQLHLIGGYYYIPAGKNVIVKTSKDAAVEYFADASGNNSCNYNSNDVDQNEIKSIAAGTDDQFAASIKETAADAGKVVYFLAPIAEYGLFWTGFKDERIVSAGQFYLWANPTAGAARVVWLDGSEEDQIITGINTIETKKAVVDGVTYNLAGQKVDANYKGVVIKDGKKFFQK